MIDDRLRALLDGALWRALALAKKEVLENHERTKKAETALARRTIELKRARCWANKYVGFVINELPNEDEAEKEFNVAMADESVK